MQEDFFRSPLQGYKYQIDATILSFNKDFKGIINIGTGRETSVLDIFYKLKELTSSRVAEKHVPFPPCGFKRGCLSIEKVKKLLDWAPKYSLGQGLRKTVAWFKDNYY